MIFTIYYWGLFVIILLFVALPTLVYLVQLNEEGAKAGKSSYLPFFTCVLSGLVPIVGSMVMGSYSVGIIWKITVGISCLVSFITCFRYTRYDKHFFFSFVMTLGVTITPFVYYAEIVPTSEKNIVSYFDEHFPIVLLSLWIPLFLFGMLMGYILVPRDKEYISTSLSDNKSKKIEDQNTSINNVIKNLETQNITLKAQIKNLNNSITQLQIQGLVSKFPHSDNKSSDARIGAILTQLRDDMSILKTHASQYHVTEMTSDQETLVRELSHFLATPLATIDASCNALQGMMLKGKDQAKLTDNMERILSSVKMCNGIIGTYKEIFAGGHIEDSQNLPDLIKAAFKIYKERDNKQLNITVKVENQYPSISNYYVMSIILPLLSNAVTAAKINSMIEVSENNGVFRVSNYFKDNVDLANFEIDGYSSKPNHQGVGLYTVRHLLARRKLGSLSYYKKDNRIIFEVPIINNDNG